MELRVFTEPQMGASYDQQLAFARLSEELDFDAFFRSDHYIAFHGAGLPGPTDSWVTLGGIARETSRIRLGTMVTSATFRHPGVLAISVAQVDAMSGGRVDLGIGAGWNETEHLANAIPFGSSFSERFEWLTEQLEIITGMWKTPEGEKFSYGGKHYKIVDSPGLPKPVQKPHPPIIIGGFGPKRTPRLAARYADEYNIPFVPINIAADRVKAIRESCERIGRDPSSIVLSSAQVVCVGADEAEFARRAEKVGRPPEQLRGNCVAGTPEEARTFVSQLAELGITRIYLQFLDLDDHDHLRIVAAEVGGN